MGVLELEGFVVWPLAGTASDVDGRITHARWCTISPIDLENFRPHQVHLVGLAPTRLSLALPTSLVTPLLGGALGLGFRRFIKEN